MERNWKGKLSKCSIRERTGKLSIFVWVERKGMLSEIFGQMTMYVFGTVEYIRGLACKAKGNLSPKDTQPAEGVETQNPSLFFILPW